jgi:hypothetical protein
MKETCGTHVFSGAGWVGDYSSCGHYLVRERYETLQVQCELGYKNMIAYSL